MAKGKPPPFGGKAKPAFGSKGPSGGAKPNPFAKSKGGDIAMPSPAFPPKKKK